MHEVLRSIPDLHYTNKQTKLPWSPLTSKKDCFKKKFKIYIDTNRELLSCSISCWRKWVSGRLPQLISDGKCRGRTRSELRSTELFCCPTQFKPWLLSKHAWVFSSRMWVSFTVWLTLKTVKAHKIMKKRKENIHCFFVIFLNYSISLSSSSSFLLSFLT